MRDVTKTYEEKRSFEQTPEPPPETKGWDVDPGSAPPGTTFVIQQHYATRLHFDLRLEMLHGDVPVLVSWAVPKNLPLKKGLKHLAVHTEDHPVEYGSFEGTIPEGNYGAGEVRIFDAGAYEMLEQAPGKLTFRLAGERMRGIWHLIQTKRNEGRDWLMFLRENQRLEPEPPPELAPMLATVARSAFDDDGWIFEPKWDGVRALAVCGEGQTMLASRNQRDITATYPDLAELHRRLVAIDAILDGEIVAMVGGRPSFERLQGRINLQNPRDIKRATKENPVSFVAFDLVYLDGRSLVERPLEERKSVLERIVVPSDLLQISPTTVGEGTVLAEAARAAHLEGILAKKLGCGYRPGKRARDWLKIKVVHEADLVIGGWSRGEGARSAFGALLAGAYEDGDLRYVGAVGTGFDHKTIDELLTLLHECEADECPFAGGAEAVRSAGRFGKVRDPRWVHPVMVAKVEFRELTSAGKLRAPAYKGLRQDKPAQDCLYSEIVAIGEAAPEAGDG